MQAIAIKGQNDLDKPLRSVARRRVAVIKSVGRVVFWKVYIVLGRLDFATCMVHGL
jgi:hypothetical protein